MKYIVKTVSCDYGPSFSGCATIPTWLFRFSGKFQESEDSGLAVALCVIDRGFCDLRDLRIAGPEASPIGLQLGCLDIGSA